MSFVKTTEQDSNYNHLDKMSVSELIRNINNEDKTVPLAVEKELPQIEILIEQVTSKLKVGGRLFYMGAGTSGRLGIVDASECPPTFGVPHELVVGLIAGGDSAIRKAVEFAEDSTTQGWKDLQDHQINTKDVPRDEGERYANRLKEQGKLLRLDEYNTNHVGGALPGLASGGPGANAFEDAVNIVVEHFR